MNTDKLIHIGFWTGPQTNNEPYLVDVTTRICKDWNPEERDKVISYLKSQKDVNWYRGWSTCRICGIHNGSTEMSDGVYVWPEGYVHYLEKHNVLPPKDFIKYVLSKS